MAQPYVGEVRMFAGNFAPAGWMFCEGQLVPISEYETLFQLIGTNYGGDGQSTFAMPDMRGRIPIHQGGGYVLAETGGFEEVALSVAELPSHSHTPLADANSGTSASLVGHTWANSGAAAAYSTDPNGPTMAANAVAATGGSQPHSNLQPFLCVDFIISLYGIYPSPS